MNKLLALIIFTVTTAQAFCQEVTTESIPNSELHVSFPSNWTFTRPYIGDGKYSSIHVNLPKGEHGDTPAYPEFDFEFLSSEFTDKKLRKLLDRNLSSISIEGIESKVFTYKNEVRYTHLDTSHSYTTLKVTGYLVPINKGHLICKLSTHFKEESVHTKYTNILQNYCASAIESARANKLFRN